jgi:predicted ribosome quality control (RQC) complex YloA/Tae2 family protein
MLEILENNIKYKLGRNAKENFVLIDEAYKLNDNYWWFHLEDHPSGHCIVHTETIDKSISQYAASLVKQYSKLKEQKKVKIIYTQIKFVKKNKTMGEVKLLNKPLTICI